MGLTREGITEKSHKVIQGGGVELDFEELIMYNLAKRCYNSDSNI